MDQRTLYSRTIHFQKIAADNFFELLSIFQKGGENMLKHSLERCSWMPEQGKKSYLLLVKECANHTETIKKLVDQGYIEIDRYWSGDQGKKANEKATEPEEKDDNSNAKESASEPIKATHSVTQVKKTNAKATPTRSATNVTRKTPLKKTSASAKNSTDDAPAPAKRTTGEAKGTKAEPFEKPLASVKTSTDDAPKVTRQTRGTTQVVKPNQAEVKEAAPVSAVKTGAALVKVETSTTEQEMTSKIAGPQGDVS